MDEVKKLVKKYPAQIHQAQWDGSFTGKHFLKEE